MTLLIEEDPADLICADDWSEVVACPKDRIRLELEQKVAEFQKNNGRITEIKPGVMVGKTEFAGRMVTNNSGKFSAEEVKAYVQRKTDGVHSRIRSQDAEAVAMLQTLMDDAPNATFLAKQLQCSDNRLQRLLLEHFPTDERADKFRHRDRDQQKLDTEKQLVEKIRRCLADGMIGIWPICKVCHASFEAVTAANKKHKLGIPRGKGGAKKKELA